MFVFPIPQRRNYLCCILLQVEVKCQQILIKWEQNEALAIEWPSGAKHRIKRQNEMTFKKLQRCSFSLSLLPDLSGKKSCLGISFASILLCMSCCTRANSCSVLIVEKGYSHLLNFQPPHSQFFQACLQVWNSIIIIIIITLYVIVSFILFNSLQKQHECTAVRKRKPSVLQVADLDFIQSEKQSCPFLLLLFVCLRWSCVLKHLLCFLFLILLFAVQDHSSTHQNMLVFFHTGRTVCSQTDTHTCFTGAYLQRLMLSLSHAAPSCSEGWRR